MVEIVKSIEIVHERLNGNLKNLCLHSPIEVPDSYAVIIANDVKRKIAISSPQKGWINIIESKEVNDYTMLFYISKELQVEVLAVIQADVIGAWGFVELSKGEVVSSYYSEEDDEIEELLEHKLKEKEIYGPLHMFREVVREKESDWEIVYYNKVN